MKRQSVLAGTLMALAVLGASGCDFARKCEVVPTEVASFCVPDGGAAPNVTLQVRENCGTCDDEAPVCSAKVDGNVITLDLVVTRCEQLPGTACPAMCRMAVADCKLGPLPEGEYTVKSGNSQKTMTVSSAGAASCEAAVP